MPSPCRPGAIGAFRKEAIERAGGLTTDTLAEDCDLTMRINEAGYIIENENYAVAMTEQDRKTCGSLSSSACVGASV